MEILEIVEATPVDYGQNWPPLGLSDAAKMIDPGAIWARLESWTGYRWAPRQVTLLIEGPGPVRWPVRPFEVGTVERWDAGWSFTDFTDGPRGPEVGEGTYRVIGIAGRDEAAPYEVIEAFKRLAEYMAEGAKHPGVVSYSVDVGPINESWKRDRAGLAAAIQQSGAADLLRQYRRAK